MHGYSNVKERENESGKKPKGERWGGVKDIQGINEKEKRNCSDIWWVLHNSNIIGGQPDTQNLYRPVKRWTVAADICCVILAEIVVLLYLFCFMSYGLPDIVCYRGCDFTYLTHVYALLS
jgi:hypothetical protein